MEIDTGAAVSIVSAAVVASKFFSPKLQRSDITLKKYAGEEVQVKVIFKVNVQYGCQKVSDLELIVVDGSGPSLIGLNWLHIIKLDLKIVTLMSGGVF